MGVGWLADKIVTMNAKEFFDLVSRMRKAQKDYFATRSTDSLFESKRLERAVDAEISRVEDILNKRPTQQTLF